MQCRIFSVSCSLALASAMAMAQSSNQNPVPAQTDSPDQQVGIAGQSAPADQQNQRRPAGPQRQAEFLARQLGLSPAQEAQVKPIIADRQRQIQSLIADTTLAPRARRARMQGVMQDSRNRIEAVLTDSQKQQFEQMLADRRARRQQERGQLQGQQPAQPQQPQAQ